MRKLRKLSIVRKAAKRAAKMVGRKKMFRGAIRRSLKRFRR